jgi:putative flippase GtrA
MERDLRTINFAFVKYLFVGSVVGGLACFCIWLASHIIENRPYIYAVLITIVYVLGIFLSYGLHKNFTFKDKSTEKKPLKFIVVALASAALVSAFSTALFILIDWPKKILPHSGWLSFCIANLCVAYLSFHANRLWVFKLHPTSKDA